MMRKDAAEILSMPAADYNSGRHYEAGADYSNRDNEDLRRQGPSHYRYGMADERFGHEVRCGYDDGNRARGSRSDYESYRRYERSSPNFDNDYSTGFGGRNYSPKETHYGEGSNDGNLNRWSSGERHQRPNRQQERDSNRR